MAESRQILPWVADAGHSRVGDHGAAFSSLDAPEYLLPPLPEIVLVIAHHGFFDAEVVQELHCHAGVLGGDEIHRAQNLQPPGAHIPQIADGGAYNV